MMVESKKSPVAVDKNDKIPASQLTRYTSYNQHSACKSMLGRQALPFGGCLFSGAMLLLGRVNILNIQ